MIKITQNGKEIFEVSNGAFNEVFKKLGFRPVTENTKDFVEDIANVDEVEEKKSDDVLKELEEKPISNWTKEELAFFADNKGIDLSNASKISEVRGIVKEYLQNNK